MVIPWVLRWLCVISLLLNLLGVCLFLILGLEGNFVVFDSL